jgi:hypothetical protein
MWREAPRSLRLEFLITILLIEVLALATMVVLTNPGPTRDGRINEESTISQ